MTDKFEVRDSKDWGDNGLNDLHSMLFNKTSCDIITDTNGKQRHTNKNPNKKLRTKMSGNKEKQISDEGNGAKMITLTYDKGNKVDKEKVGDKTNGKQKSRKRKPEYCLELQDAKRKVVLNRKVQKEEMNHDDDEDKSELVDKVYKKEKKIKRLKEVKVAESKNEIKLSNSEVELTEVQLKKKKKRKRKAINKFKTEEYVNSRKLCGRFVDLTMPLDKGTKNKPKILQKIKNSEKQANHSVTEIKQCPKLNDIKKKKKDKNIAKEENENDDIGNSKKLQDKDLSKKKQVDLRTKMENKLKGARFRFINEKLYSCTGESALELFTKDKEAFQVYHDGFVEQVKSWPVNPVDKMIEDLIKMPSSKVVGDFGCGDAKVAECVKQKVHSFDLVSTKDSVVACNMENVPLSDNQLDIAIYCLSLMGTNWIDYLKEANRVLKNGGILKIAEVSSRFQNLKAFILAMKRLGFSQIYKDTSNKFFISFDFKKQRTPQEISEGMNEILKPCLYKKR